MNERQLIAKEACNLATRAIKEKVSLRQLMSSIASVYSFEAKELMFKPILKEPNTAPVELNKLMLELADTNYKLELEGNKEEQDSFTWNQLMQRRIEIIKILDKNRNAVVYKTENI